MLEAARSVYFAVSTLRVSALLIRGAEGVSMYIHGHIQRLVVRYSALPDTVVVNSECIWQQFLNRSDSVLQSVL